MSSCGKAYLGWKQSNQVVWALGCYTEGIKAQAGRFPTLYQKERNLSAWAFLFVAMIRMEAIVMSVQVGIIMGSDSDFPLMKKAVDVLEEFGVGYEVKVSSAHRTPEDTLTYAETAVERGLKVIIAGAGAAAHLPGVIAAKTTLPVIGVPINATALNGLDALYAIVQMPSGVPVASVGIDGAKNAGLLAVQILATADDSLRDKLVRYKEDMKESVQKKNAKIQETFAQSDK